MLSDLTQSLHREVLGNPLARWATAVLVARGAFLVVVAVRGFVSRRWRPRAEHCATGAALLADGVGAALVIYDAIADHRPCSPPTGSPGGAPS